MAGNVATYAGADYLAPCSAAIVKVGKGNWIFIMTTALSTNLESANDRFWLFLLFVLLVHFPKCVFQLFMPILGLVFYLR
jgi:hypothetical protein